MDLQDQNWRNFTANHLHEWHGIWTRYTPQGDVQESFQSLRSFRSNSEQTEIAQTNYSTYADGRKLEHSWEYNQQSNSLADGMYHPQNNIMRGLFFASGHAGWVTKQLKTGSFFAVEIFFKSENLRHSVGIVYDDSGNLFRTANIREDATGFTSKYWSGELNQLPERNLSGNWQGTAITMTPDLQISQPIPTQLHWGREGHKTFFLPDGVSISCPSQINIGTPFILVVNWLVKTDEMQQIIANYDDTGAFSSLRLELFHLVDTVVAS
ncbi:MAG: DUF3598 family protein [Nostocaceae cyanobacterium]|nr:DUF3598 family protein [Nostocaceae cyanobacterium]